jgi:hypothetical protein
VTLWLVSLVSRIFRVDTSTETPKAAFMSNASNEIVLRTWHDTALAVILSSQAATIEAIEGWPLAHHVRHGVPWLSSRTATSHYSGSFGGIVELTLGDYQESASPIHGQPLHPRTFDPPASPAPLAVSHLSACTAPPVLSEESGLTAESINGSPCTIPATARTLLTVRTNGVHVLRAASVC